jgi:hypothetical protein
MRLPIAEEQPRALWTFLVANRSLHGERFIELAHGRNHTVFSFLVSAVYWHRTLQNGTLSNENFRQLNCVFFGAFPTHAIS